MKFLSFFLFLILSIVPLKSKNVSIYYPNNYIVIDASSNFILEGKNINKAYSVASISKIMTAIIALEHKDDLFKVIEVDEIIKQTEGSSLYLEIGNKITCLDLVYGLMLRSGNDASLLIAKHIAGSVDKFVELMNIKAQELNLANTIFSNPNGLDVYDDGNISSCLDMAYLMSYCIENPLFREIISTKYYYNNIKGKWKNKNRLLFDYKYSQGGKTGYTKKAKRTLINYALKDNKKLIVVTLNCSDDFTMHKLLFEKYFNEYNYLSFLKKGTNYISTHCIYSYKDYGLFLPKNIKLKGKRKYIYINNQLILIFVDEYNNEYKSEIIDRIKLIS